MIGDGCGLESSLTMTGSICDRLKIVEARYEVEQDFCDQVQKIGVSQGGLGAAGLTRRIHHSPEGLGSEAQFDRLIDPLPSTLVMLFAGALAGAP